MKDLKASVDADSVTSQIIESNIVRTGDPAMVDAMVELIKATRVDGNSIGGTIETVVRNCPTALGVPLFDRLEADLTKARPSELERITEP